ncbi:hypothetical protein CXG81DRAFT_27104 [Caulochytrium protostelioides]|uniref:Pentacotripeptide-repeat region of PRORP domain-containing protein n=1 Tax=Caulochytrium protostelioides TaxID=1555241 RepID=A0A4P9X4Z8_9FUNG|nr:hypothetical protein CXG81DRAFT_27104 [Caulochytrium protostelioides]|eukprot:RKP00176.1 hypothetical protein CXG81DRAFT_27104 [Caulochytrium protostelioides]
MPSPPRCPRRLLVPSASGLLRIPLSVWLRPQLPAFPARTPSFAALDPRGSVPPSPVARTLSTTSSVWARPSPRLSKRATATASERAPRAKPRGPVVLAPASHVATAVDAYHHTTTSLPSSASAFQPSSSFRPSASSSHEPSVAQLYASFQRQLRARDWQATWATYLAITKLPQFRWTSSLFEGLLRHLSQLDGPTIYHIEQVFQHMRQLGIPVETGHYNARLRFKAKANREADVRSLNETLQELETAGLEPNADTYVIYLDAYVRQGRFDQAEAFLQTMASNGITPAACHYDTLLTGYLEADRPDDVERLLAAMRADDVVCSNATFNTLVGLYCRRGQLAQAQRFFDAIPGLGGSHDLVLYTTLMSGYSRAGDYEQVASLFQQMQQADALQPDGPAYTVYIGALGRSGDVERVMREIAAMRAKGIPVTRAMYEQVLLHMSEGGHTAALVALLTSMNTQGIDISAKSLTLAMKAFAHVYDVAGVDRIAAQLKSRGMSLLTQQYNCLIQAYAYQGDAAKVWRVYTEAHAAREVDGETYRMVCECMLAQGYIHRAVLVATQAVQTSAFAAHGTPPPTARRGASASSSPSRPSREGLPAYLLVELLETCFTQKAPFLAMHVLRCLKTVSPASATSDAAAGGSADATDAHRHVFQTHQKSLNQLLYDLVFQDAAEHAKASSTEVAEANRDHRRPLTPPSEDVTAGHGFADLTDVHRQLGAASADATNAALAKTLYAELRARHIPLSSRAVLAMLTLHHREHALLDLVRVWTAYDTQCRAQHVALDADVVEAFLAGVADMGRGATLTALLEMHRQSPPGSSSSSSSSSSASSPPWPLTPRSNELLALICARLGEARDLQRRLLTMIEEATLTPSFGLEVLRMLREHGHHALRREIEAFFEELAPEITDGIEDLVDPQS